jgi:uncharacterized cupin superfamily protein
MMKIFEIIRNAVREPERMELPAPQILHGSPEMACDSMTDNRQTHTGFWSCTAGSFKWLYPCDEVVHILEGEALLCAPLGNKTPQWQTIRPGDSVHFPGGSEALWMVPKYIRKFYVIIDRKPPSGTMRVVRKVWNLVKAAAR